MKKTILPNELKNITEKIVQDFNCELIDITFKLEKKINVLRVTIDGKKVSLNICANISREISKWLDEHEDLLKCDSYTLEVSSPGENRPLKSKEDFIKCIDKLIYFETKIKAADGRKRYKGRVTAVTDDVVSIYITEESAAFDLRIADISKTRIEYEF